MLLTCGDALIDFVPAKTDHGIDAFAPRPGGSCLNVAVAMARLGALTGFLGAISDDFLGDLIACHALSSDVSLRFAQRLSFPSTAAFINFTAADAGYVFYDTGTAARNWNYTPGSVDFAAVTAIHFGSTTLVYEDLAVASLALLKEAKGRSSISFDPNCRPQLVRDRRQYTLIIEEFARQADIVKMSEVDFEFLYGHRDYEKKASQLFSKGVALFVVTKGDKGSVAYHRDGAAAEVEGRKVQVADTVGAGDTFMGALLVGLKESSRLESAGSLELNSVELEKTVRFASNCAALTCERVGADPPHRQDIPSAWWADIKLTASSN
jgi:fructokinase